MKRRKFFETLGFALAGAAIVKPTFSEDDLPKQKVKIKEIPNQEFAPVDFNGYNAKCIIHDKKHVITEAQGISGPRIERDFIDLTTIDEPDKCIPTPIRQSYSMTLLDCKYTNSLRESFESGNSYSLKVIAEGMKMTCEIVIMEISITSSTFGNPNYCDVGIEVISELTTEQI
jgi:hypothetical protein